MKSRKTEVTDKLDDFEKKLKIKFGRVGQANTSIKKNKMIGDAKQTRIVEINAYLSQYKESKSKEESETV